MLFELEQLEHEEPVTDKGVFGFIIAHSQPLGITDWAENHDHYLYGVPKRHAE